MVSVAQRLSGVVRNPAHHPHPSITAFPAFEPIAQIRVNEAGLSGSRSLPSERQGGSSPGCAHSGCVNASKTLLRAIAKILTAYYVNVHTAKYPGGAIRAQV